MVCVLPGRASAFPDGGRAQKLKVAFAQVFASFKLGIMCFDTSLTARAQYLFYQSTLVRIVLLCVTATTKAEVQQQPQRVRNHGVTYILTYIRALNARILAFLRFFIKVKRFGVRWKMAVDARIGWLVSR